MASDIPITGNGLPKGSRASRKIITFESGRPNPPRPSVFVSESEDEPLEMVVTPGPGGGRETTIQLGEDWSMVIRKRTS